MLCSINGENVAYRAEFTEWKLDGGKIPYGIFQVRKHPLLVLLCGHASLPTPPRGDVSYQSNATHVRLRSRP
jgi:hypothetical protein